MFRNRFEDPRPTPLGRIPTPATVGLTRFCRATSRVREEGPCQRERRKEVADFGVLSRLRGRFAHESEQESLHSQLQRETQRLLPPDRPS